MGESGWGTRGLVPSTVTGLTWNAKIYYILPLLSSLMCVGKV